MRKLLFVTLMICLLSQSYIYAHALRNVLVKDQYLTVYPERKGPDYKGKQIKYGKCIKFQSNAEYYRVKYYTPGTLKDNNRSKCTPYAIVPSGTICNDSILVDNNLSCICNSEVFLDKKSMIQFETITKAVDINEDDHTYKSVPWITFIEHEDDKFSCYDIN